MSTNIENEEDRTLAVVLTTLIWALWGVYLFVIITGIFFYDRVLIALTLAGCALLGIPMVLLKRHHLHTASLVITLIELSTVTIIATVGQGIRDLALVTFPIIFIFAGLALERKYFLICVGLALVAVCWLVFGETFGWFVTKPFQGGATNWFYLLGVTLILLVAALAVDLLASYMRKSLERTRAEVVQRKQAEEALRAVSNRQQVLLLAIPDIIMEVDNHKIYTWANQPGLEFFGEDVIGQAAAFYFAGEQDANEVVNPLFDGAENITYVESWHRRRDGQKRLLAWRCHVLKGANGYVTGTLSSARDITEQKQVEIALAEERNLLVTLMDNLPDMIYFKDAQSRIIRSNRAHARRVGLTDPEQMIGKTDFDLFGEEHARAAYEDEQEIIRLGQPLLDKEEREIFQDGNALWVSTTKMPRRDQQGRIVGTFGISRDITERKRAEEVLHQSEEKFRNLFNYAGIGMFRTRLDGSEILDVNERLLTIFGRTREEMHGSASVIHWADPTEREEMLRRLKAEGSLIDYECGMLNKQGEVRRCLMSLRDPEEGILEGSILDITERKQAEAALSESEARFRAIFEHANDAIFIDNTEDQILEVNQRACEILGYSRDELLQMHIADLQAPEVRNPSGHVIHDEYLLHGNNVFEGQNLHCSGRRFPVEISVARVESPQGDLYISIVRDITARKQVEKLQDAIYRISQAADYAKTLDSLYPSIHAIIQEVMVADNFYIALYDEKNDLLSFPYSVDERDSHFPPRKPTKGLTEYVLRTGRTVLCDEALYQGLIQRAEIELVGAHSPIWLGVPLIVEGKPIGVMVVQDYINARAYGEREVRILEFVSTQVAQTIVRKRLEEEIRSLSLTDELTGLYNRRGFTLLAEQEVKLAHRMKRAMLLFFGDVDNLKTINDTWGHAQGDLALQEISAILKENFRESDILARLGGNEFVVLAVDASKENAETMTNRLQAALEARSQQAEKTYHLTLSMGVARYDPEAPCTVSELITQADGLMYDQKQARKGKKVGRVSEPNGV